MTPAAVGGAGYAPEAAAPPTVGVEEEFVLADRRSRSTVSRSLSVVRAARARLGGAHVTPELSQSQVETVSAVCRTGVEVEAEVLRLRAGAAAAAAEHDCLLVPSGVAVLGRSGPPPVLDRARYQALARRFGPVVHGQGVNACHVHVGVADREDAVRGVNHLRDWMPLLLALTANSPYSDGADTGYASWRSVLWSRWPSAGPPPHLRDAAHYQRVVDQLVSSGAALDPAMVYWHVRPSAHLPTIEVRIADVMPDAKTTTAYALLVRALVGHAVEAGRSGEPAPDVPDLLLRAACWQAARHGSVGTLPGTHTRDCAPTDVGRLIEELWKRAEPHLSGHGRRRTGRRLAGRCPAPRVRLGAAETCGGTARGWPTGRGGRPRRRGSVRSAGGGAVAGVAFVAPGRHQSARCPDAWTELACHPSATMDIAGFTVFLRALFGR